MQPQLILISNLLYTENSEATILWRKLTKPF